MPIVTDSRSICFHNDAAAQNMALIIVKHRRRSGRGGFHRAVKADANGIGIILFQRRGGSGMAVADFDVCKET